MKDKQGNITAPQNPVCILFYADYEIFLLKIVTELILNN